MRFRKRLLFVSSIFAVSTLAMPAMAQGGKGGYANIKPLPGTMQISVNNDGRKYYVVNRPITVNFKISGAPGKNRKLRAWNAGVGMWKRGVGKADTYKQTLSLKDVYDGKKLAARCEQLLTYAAASKNKTKNKLRNNGWNKTFTYSLKYKTTMVVDNPLTPIKEALRRHDEASQDIVVSCLGFERKSNPKPNKKPNKQTSQNEKKGSGSVGIKGAKINENQRDRPTEEVAFVFSNIAPARDTDAPRMTGGNDKVAMPMRSDLYAESGGLNPEDDTSYVLLIGNKGDKTAAATELRFFLSMKGQEILQAQYPIPEIKAGEFYELHVPSDIPLDWVETAYARIDQPNIVAEMDEKNNGFSFVQKRQAKLEHDSAMGMINNIKAYKLPAHVSASEVSHGQAAGKRMHKPLIMALPKK